MIPDCLAFRHGRGVVSFPRQMIPEQPEQPKSRSSFRLKWRVRMAAAVSFACVAHGCRMVRYLWLSGAFGCFQMKLCRANTGRAARLPIEVIWGVTAHACQSLRRLVSDQSREWDLGSLPRTRTISARVPDIGMLAPITGIADAPPATVSGRDVPVPRSSGPTEVGTAWNSRPGSRPP